MQQLKARVHNGRLTLDEPTDLPEGTEVPLEIAPDWDDLERYNQVFSRPTRIAPCCIESLRIPSRNARQAPRPSMQKKCSLS